MVFLGQVPLSAAVPVAGRRTVRLSFTPLADGRVRQLAEGLAADGSWSVNYDFIYSRRQAAP
jgi:hypothetical protein